ncbi:hypothetical protein FI667_g13503, partial [Globisporangium splendens]
MATGAALQNRYGVVSDYVNCWYIKGMKYASADGIYCNGFVIANDKFLVATVDLLSIILMKIIRYRFQNVYIYDVDGNTVNQRARLAYPQTISWSDLMHININVLSHLKFILSRWNLQQSLVRHPPSRPHELVLRVKGDTEHQDSPRSSPQPHRIRTNTSAIPKTMCSDKQLLVTASICSTLHVAVVICLASAWRFPIPFLWGIAMPLWMVSLNLVHLVVLRGKLLGPNGLIAAILVYAPGIVIQFPQIFIYVAFSAIFERSKQVQQIAMAFLFPFVKYAMRKLLRKYTKQLGDRSGEISTSGIEVCATLYQSVIMQAAPSGLISGLIMAIDVVQGLFTVKMFMDKNSIVPQDRILATAFKLLRTNSFLHITPAAQVFQGPNTADAHDALNSPLEEWKPEQQQLLVRHAFELAATAETILLMEYFEFSIPLTNAVFAAVASQFPSAHFDPKLDVFIEDPGRLLAVLKTTVLCSFLQLLSFVSVHFVMKSRYNLLALHHVAFTLEYHARSVQGKLMAWLILVFHFNGTHYGTDLTLHFGSPVFYNTTDVEPLS